MSGTGSMLLAASLAGASAALAISPGGGIPRLEGDDQNPEESGVRERRVPPGAAALVCALACWLLIGGTLGVLVGLAVALLAPRLFARMEPRAVRRRRVELVAAAPVVADLIGSALLAGVPLERVVVVLARSMGGAAGEVLDQLARRLSLGADQVEAWLALAREPGFEALGRAAARSARTGAPLADILLTAGEELRGAATAAGLAEVRSAGISAVLPLGLCLLPAFVLLGIVPVVAGMIPKF